MLVVATAGWSIPKPVAHRFPEEGSGLSRYAAVFKGVEINSTFYRSHRMATFERWADSVPDGFRFAVKMPRTISHELRLRDIDRPFATFVEEVSALGGKLGPILCQLPPSLKFDPGLAADAFAAMRTAFSGVIVIEPRHVSWATREAGTIIRRHGIEPVLADPAPVWRTQDFSGPAKYCRLHGSPQMYYTSYGDTEIRAFREHLSADGWCVFDNTASGAAIVNALSMLDDEARGD